MALPYNGELGHRILEAARHELEAGVREQPAGSNTGPRVVQYQRATFLAGTGWPWCAAFVCFVMAAAGAPLAYNTAGAYDLLRWATEHGWATRNPQPGDAAVFELGSGHVGIVESVGAESITTIDGNWSDRVTRHTTPRNTFRGFVRNPAHGPAEAQRAAALAAARKPLYVVTTNADGERRIVFRAHSRRRLVRWMMHHTLRKGIRITRKR